MADFAGVINQLKINNEEEKQRDSNLNKNIAFKRSKMVLNNYLVKLFKVIIKQIKQ